MKTYIWMENDALYEYCDIAYMANSLEEARSAAIKQIITEHAKKIHKLKEKYEQGIPSENSDLDTGSYKTALDSEIRRCEDLTMYITETMPLIQDTLWYEAINK